MCLADEDSAPRTPYKTALGLRPAPTAAASTGTSSAGARANGLLVGERIPFRFEGVLYRNSRIAYVTGREPRPLILVHPNYAGLKQAW